MAATTTEKKERAKRYKTNEVKKKQMTLSAAGMSHDGGGGGGSTSGVEISTRVQDHNIDEFFLSKCNTFTSDHILIFVSKTTYNQILTRQAVIIL